MYYYSDAFEVRKAVQAASINCQPGTGSCDRVSCGSGNCTDTTRHVVYWVYGVLRLTGRQPSDTSAMVGCVDAKWTRTVACCGWKRAENI